MVNNFPILTYLTSRGSQTGTSRLAPASTPVSALRWRVWKGQIAFATLLSRVPDLALAIPRDEVRWRDATFLRGLTRLPVTF